MLKRKKDSLDYEKVNEGLYVGVKLLKLLFFLFIILSIYVCNKLITDWKIIPFVLTMLGIISPLFIGIVVAWLFDPFVTKLQKKGINRVLGTFFIYFLLILASVLLVNLILPSISAQVNDIITSAPGFINGVKEWVEGAVEGIEDLTHYDLTDLSDQIYSSINQLGLSITVDLPTRIVSILSGVVSGGINLIFGLIIGFYMLFDFHNVRKHLLAFIPKKFHKDTIDLTDRVNENLRNFVHGTILIMCILFVFQSIGLSLAGMKAPLVFGLFCAITNVIPYLGPYIGGIPTVLIGFSISPVVGLFSLISVVVCQIVESYFLQPVVMGKTMKLHPVTIMIGLLIFGHFFGIIGMILATPTIAIAKTIALFFDEKYDIVGKIQD
ncbi:MAG: AI-2E family transporter [Bacilli bacterium]|nr:AI-2E family transporter [Bacilli bacterium]